MDTTTLYLIYAAVLGGLGFFLLFMLSWKFMILGLRVFLGKLRFGQDACLVIFYNKNGDFGKISIVDLSKSTFKRKKAIHTITKEMLMKGRFWGLPYILMCDDDVKSTPGIYFIDTDENGEKQYLRDTNDNFLYDEFGEKIPRLVPIKQGASLEPGLLATIIKDEALTSALKNLFNTQNKLMIFIMIAAGASVAAAYFAYDFNANQLPDIMNLLRQAAACGGK